MDFTSHGQLLGVLFIHYHQYCICYAYIYWIPFTDSKPQLDLFLSYWIPFILFAYQRTAWHLYSNIPSKLCRAVLKLCRAVLKLCKAVLGLCCGCAAKIPHILLYKEAFCLPFVSSDHPIIPSPTGHWSTTHSPFSILNILPLLTLINPYILPYLTAIHIHIYQLHLL